jgi:hypothetical protein
LRWHRVKPSWRLARSLATVVLYAAAVVWLTWPLAPNAATHLPNTSGPSSTDVPYITWALAWQSHALATDPMRYFEANIYHPAPHALLYGDPGLAALPIFAPIFLESGNPALAINVVLLAGITLTAWSLHYVVESWTGSWLAGLVGAATFLTNPWEIPYFFGWAPTYAILCYLPFVAYLAAHPIERLDDAVALALLVALQSTGNMVYVAASTLVPVMVLAAARLARGSSRASGTRLALVLVLACLLLAPIYFAYARVRLENRDLARQSTWAHVEAPADASGDPTAAPTRHERFLPQAFLWRRDTTWLAPAMLALVLLGGIAAWWRPVARAGLESIWRHGLLWSAVGLFLATPKLSWGGTSIMLPHYWLLERCAPFANAVLREDRRLGLPCLVGFALLAGAALVTCARTVPARFATSARVLVAAIVVGSAAISQRALATPMGLLPAESYGTRISAILGAVDGPVLQLPVGRNGVDPRYHAPAMYRSIGHWEPLLNGYSSYWPAGFAERMTLAARLPDADALAELVRETGLTAVVVNLVGSTPEERVTWRTAAAQHDVGRLHLAVRETEDLLFLVDKHGLR